MTTLAEYLKSPSALTLTKLAQAVGVSKGRLSQLRDSTDWPPSLALDVERETGGALNASSICPIVSAARDGIAA